MSDESNKRYVPSKEDYERSFADFLDSKINPEIQAAKKMGYTTDQAIELVKVFELGNALESIDGSLVWLEPPLHIYPGGDCR